MSTMCHVYILHRLSIIINNYSSSPNGPLASWAIDSEAMMARGIIVLVKSN